MVMWLHQVTNAHLLMFNLENIVGGGAELYIIYIGLVF